jgi:hypothetical protein
VTAVAGQTLPRPTAEANEAFVVINGWVLPSQYFKSPSA